MKYLKRSYQGDHLPSVAQDNNTWYQSKPTREWLRQRTNYFLDFPQSEPRLWPHRDAMELIQASHLQMYLNWGSSAKMIGQSCSWMSCNSDPELPKALILSHCCQNSSITTNSKSSLYFSLQQNECLVAVFSKNIRTYNCSCVIRLNTLCWPVILTWITFYG